MSLLGCHCSDVIARMSLLVIARSITLPLLGAMCEQLVVVTTFISRNLLSGDTQGLLIRVSSVHHAQQTGRRSTPVASLDTYSIGASRRDTKLSKYDEPECRSVLFRCHCLSASSQSSALVVTSSVQTRPFKNEMIGSALDGCICRYSIEAAGAG
jgi:hypothetical protein